MYICVYAEPICSIRQMLLARKMTEIEILKLLSTFQHAKQPDLVNFWTSLTLRQLRVLQLQ